MFLEYRISGIFFLILMVLLGIVGFYIYDSLPHLLRDDEIMYAGV